MNNLYDLLETCLQEIENGADLDTVLFRHPEHAEELRPILEASVQARGLASPDPASDLVRRNRSKVLQQAAQMREAKAVPSRRLWSVPLRRALVSLSVLVVLFMASTGIVHASSTTLPGDNLYPVKRTWEDLRVLLTFNTQARDALEVEHENERLNELNELFAEKRSAPVDFAGTVTSQSGNVWLVSKIPVQISAKTELGTQPVTVGQAVRVRGFTQADGTVLAERVELLSAGIPLPSVDDEPESGTDQEAPEQQNGSNEDHSGGESEDRSSSASQTPESEDPSGSDFSSLNGTVNSINGNVVVVNGQSMDIASAEITGTLKVGADAKVEGYYDANGVFIVTKIEFQSVSSEQSGSSENSGKSSDDNSSDHHDGGGGSDDSGGSNSGSDGGGD